MVKAAKSDNKKGFSTSEISSRVNKFYSHGCRGNSHFESKIGRIAFLESIHILFTKYVFDISSGYRLSYVHVKECAALNAHCIFIIIIINIYNFENVLFHLTTKMTEKKSTPFLTKSGIIV